MDWHHLRPWDARSACMQGLHDTACSTRAGFGEYDNPGSGVHYRKSGTCLCEEEHIMIISQSVCHAVQHHVIRLSTHAV